MIFIIMTIATITGILFVVSAMSNQIYAQNTSLTINEALEQTFGKENAEEELMRENGKTGFTMEDLYPEEELAKELANKTLMEGMSEDVKAVYKALTEQSPEYQAKQALTMKYNELKEKYYLECIINKESGEFKNTIDCITWSQDNAQIQLGLK